jgi:hypothetical protein
MMHMLRTLAIPTIAVCVTLSTLQCTAGEKSAPAPSRSGFRHRGFYLHGCWKYNYPFAVRSWQREDYSAMFQLLRRLGFDRVMLWPVLEAVPMPLSEKDAQAVRAFRPIIDDARKAGLECWLTQGVVTSRPEIAAKPWMERSLYSFMKTVRLDDPVEAEAYLRHRAALLAILNNADGYVTIDGDPGSYPGAKASDFLRVFVADRQVLDRSGERPDKQKLIPWIWSGWGTKGVWVEPIEPYVQATLAELKRGMPEPWELLPGRSAEGHANNRINIRLAAENGLLERSTLMTYEAIEFEPSLPAAVLQFDLIRDVLRKELPHAAAARGCFGNAQQPVMVIPNLYFYARCAIEPSYLSRPDEKVLADLAELFGGPPELLVPAWSCLRLGLDRLPADLPKRLRAARLAGEAAQFIPGGPMRYLSILAAYVESRIRVLAVNARTPAGTAEAAESVAEGVASMVDWWKLHHYVGGGTGDELFQWSYADADHQGILQQWCRQHVKDVPATADLAVRRLVEREVLPEAVAKPRVAELLRQR